MPPPITYIDRPLLANAPKRNLSIHAHIKRITHTPPLLIALIVLLWVPPTPAQDRPPLAAPIVAYTDAAADAVYLYDVQTRLTRRLAIGPGAHTVWDFSADGCRVLLTYAEPGQPSRVYSLRLTGDDPRSLVDTDELSMAVWDAWEPDWSPDGTKIAFTLSRPVDGGRESRVAWVPAGGGSPTFYSVAGDENTPRWSADGVWLAYVAYEQRPAGATLTATAQPEQAANAPRLREGDIWMVSADGLTKERITRFDVGSASAPQWDPTSQLIAFRYSPQPGDDQLWVIAAQPDAIPTQLSFAWHQMLSLGWLPGGERVLLTARDFGGVQAARVWSVGLVGNADTDAAQLFQVGPLADQPLDFPRYSPDGNWLAVRRAYTLLITDRNGDEMRVIGRAGNTPPVWSPGGFSGEAACH